MKRKELERLKAQGVAASKVEGARVHEQYYPSWGKYHIHLTSVQTSDPIFVILYVARIEIAEQGICIDLAQREHIGKLFTAFFGERILVYSLVYSLRTYSYSGADLKSWLKQYEKQQSGWSSKAFPPSPRAIQRTLASPLTTSWTRPSNETTLRFVVPSP